MNNNELFELVWSVCQDPPHNQLHNKPMVTIVINGTISDTLVPRNAIFKNLVIDDREYPDEDLDSIVDLLITECSYTSVNMTNIAQETDHRV